MKTYQEIYPSEPLLRSSDFVRPSAAGLLTLEYFEAELDAMPTRTFDQHHVLISLKDEPHRVENWRGGVHRDFIINRNDIVVTPAGLESGWRWHARSRCIVVTLDPKDLERFTQREMGLVLTRRQLADSPLFSDADISSAAELLLEALRAGGVGSAVMFQSLASIFLVKLVQRYGDQRSEEIAFSRSFTAGHYKRVLDFVESNYAQPLTIEEMARVAGISPSHFTRLFRQVIGETPHQFLTRFRVERAAAMLSDPARPLIDIAIACGFSDQPHLTRTFRSIVGETPGARRKRMAAAL